jgi:hypothetical protein
MAGRIAACPQCGFDDDGMSTGQLLDTIDHHTRELVSLKATAADWAGRVDDSAWSALEYLCHLRDVLLMQRDRLVVALVEDEPVPKPMYRDERVALCGYADEDPRRAGVGLELAAELFTVLARRLSPQEWSRTMIYGYPTPAARTLEWVLANTTHEAVHHHADIESAVTS